MSRVAKNPIKIPEGVVISRSYNDLTFNGKKGSRTIKIPSECLVEEVDGFIVVKPADAKFKALWGTVGRSVQACIKGVTDGFSLNIDLVGVGYRASVSGSKLNLQLGFSHDIALDLPIDVSAKTEKPTQIVLSSVCKQRLGQFAAKIRKYRPPEPYKGKGIIREKEFVLRKEGKKK